MIMTVIISVVVKTFFRSRDEDRDLGLQVSTRLRPWPSGLETETKTWTE